MGSLHSFAFLVICFGIINTPIGCLGNKGRVNEVKFLHLTDIHLDMLYNPHTSPDRMCHGGNGNAGTYGLRARCDSNYDLLCALAKQDVEFILYTGDSIRHDFDPEVPLSQPESSLSVLLVGAFIGSIGSSSDTIVVPSIGNHDVFPPGVLSGGPNPKLKSLSSSWSDFLTKSQQVRDFLHYGSFVAQVRTDLFAISLNTLFFAKSNPCASCSPGGTGDLLLNWLELKIEAVSNGSSIILFGHFPPKSDFWHSDCLDRYIRITAAYSNMISGQFFGHSHQDDYVILNHPDTKEPVGVANISSSLVPNYNPSYRIYIVDANTNKINNYNHYYFDLDVANASGNANFVLEYDWLSEYGMKDWSLDSWVHLDQVLSSNARMLSKFNRNKCVRSADKC